MEHDYPKVSQSPSGLLNLAIVAQTAQSPQNAAQVATDPDDRRWLQEALSATFEDPVKRIIADISVLNTGTPDTSKTLSILDDLLELTETIDYANDFHKCGGFPVLKEMLTNPVPEIRRKSAELWAQLMQNNPYCQEKVLEDAEILPRMLNMVETDVEPEIRTASLLGISALLRSNEKALTAFTNSDGFSVLLGSMLGTSSVKFQTRAAFLLNCICGNNPECAEQLGNMSIVQHFLTLLQKDHEQYHQHLMEALEMVLKNSETARREARRGAINLESFIRKRMHQIDDKEENQEEYDAAEGILNLLDTSIVSDDSMIGER